MSFQNRGFNGYTERNAHAFQLDLPCKVSANIFTEPEKSAEVRNTLADCYEGNKREFFPFVDH